MRQEFQKKLEAAKASSELIYSELYKKAVLRIFEKCGVSLPPVNALIPVFYLVVKFFRIDLKDKCIADYNLLFSLLGEVFFTTYKPDLMLGRLSHHLATSSNNDSKQMILKYLQDIYMAQTTPSIMENIILLDLENYKDLARLCPQFFVVPEFPDIKRSKRAFLNSIPKHPVLQGNKRSSSKDLFPSISAKKADGISNAASATPPRRLSNTKPGF